MQSNHSNGVVQRCASATSKTTWVIPSATSMDSDSIKDGVDLDNLGYQMQKDQEKYIDEVFYTTDETVSKYIHMDGSETAIKVIPSIQSVFNPLTNSIDVNHSERNKYSVFISSSMGCFMKCKFCHLTLKQAKYQKLEAQQVLSNLKAALTERIQKDPQIKERYIKLSWMGMGDAVDKPQMVYDVTLEFLDWVLACGYAKGVDGVDLSTVMPKLKRADFIQIFHNLEQRLQQYPINPCYKMDNVQLSTGAYTHKNVFRLFYSIESAIQSVRDEVIPNAMPLEQAVQWLKEYQNPTQEDLEKGQVGRYCVILHHLLVHDLNDSQPELDALVKMVNTHFTDNELRIIRYNFCSKSAYHESERFVGQIRQLSEQIQFLKVQVSPGTQVSAACGQFIVKKYQQGKAFVQKHQADGGEEVILESKSKSE